MNAPVVLGAGPAGSVAATLLARAGANPVLIDRDETVGDTICGGFLSWRTASALRELGCDPATLGARQVSRLRLFTGDREAEASLPAPAFALSRRALDGALRDIAIRDGARLEVDRIREIRPGKAFGECRERDADTVFLATGKHDVRGESRPRENEDPALGLRVRFPQSAALETLVGDAIELHFFDGGYAGIVLQEDGSANICLAVRKSLLAQAGGNPWTLLFDLAAANLRFAERLIGGSRTLPVDTIGSVPYGWIGGETADGLYRLGDQAAVIPSLAGEGMAIALASARAAVADFLAGRSAQHYQSAFARRAARPIRAAGLVSRLSEGSRGAAALTTVARHLPILSRLAMRLSRI